MKATMTNILAARVAATATALLLAAAAFAQDKAAAPAGTKPPATAAAPAAPGASPATKDSAGGENRIDTLKRIRDTGTLLLGVRESSVPFSFVDAQGVPQGEFQVHGDQHGLVLRGQTAQVEIDRQRLRH